MLSSLFALLLAAQPAAEAPNDPPPELKSETPAAEAKAPMFEPVTKVDGKTLQVVFGARAVFHLDDEGDPILDKAEKGQLAIAHTPGTVKEEFERPEKGQIAIALDGSAEKKASYLKIWNGLDYPISYRAGVLVLVKGKLEPATVKVCAVPAGGTNYETWPKPVVAVALGNFTKAADDKACK
ncbi:MAG: hypothetical protein ABW360_02545 [Phenylobacterium sp.]